MPSDGKSSHCLWQGELKRIKIKINFIMILITNQKKIVIVNNLYFLSDLYK